MSEAENQITDESEEVKRQQKRERDRLYKRKLRGSVKEILNPNTGGRNFKRDENGAITDKICTICGEWKPICQFNKRKDTPSGVRHFCKSCEAKNHKKYHKKPEPKTKTTNCKRCGVEFSFVGKRLFCSDFCKDEQSKDAQRIKNNSIHFATEAACRRCGETKPLSDFDWNGKGFKILPWACSKCKEASLKKHRRRRNVNPRHKVRRSLSKRMRELVNQAAKGGTKNLKAALGCSSSFLRSHIESQFKRGMTWDNYGTYWHVDHILPCASFDHSDPEQVARCWHYSNLQPLKAEENMEKSDSIIECQPELLLQLV